MEHVNDNFSLRAIILGEDPVAVREAMIAAAEKAAEKEAKELAASQAASLEAASKEAASREISNHDASNENLSIDIEGSKEDISYVKKSTSIMKMK